MESLIVLVGVLAWCLLGVWLVRDDDQPEPVEPPVMKEPEFMSAVRCGGETYFVRYSPSTRTQAQRQIGRWAADPELSFGWYQCFVMSSEITLRCMDWEQGNAIAAASRTR